MRHRPESSYLKKDSGYYQRRTNTIICGILVLLSALCMAIWGRNTNLTPQGVLTYITTPILRLSTYPKNIYNRISSYSNSFQEMKERISQLESENKKLNVQLLYLQQLVEEKSKLERLLQLSTNLEVKSLPATVIGRSEGELRTIIIDKGFSDGVDVNMPVVTYQGLVGRIEKSLDNAARVLLLIDQNSQVAVSVRDSSGELLVEGLVKGTYDLSKTDLEIPGGVALPAGAKIYTSPLSTFFPEGLFVGTLPIEIKHRTAYMHMRSVKINSAVDFGKVQEVLVLTDFKRNNAFSLLKEDS